MSKTLFERVNEVYNEETFVQFIQALGHDSTVDMNSWENTTITSFLEAAAEWGAASVDGLHAYDKPDNPWRRCAQILYMGKMYE
ncbi:hypothetical protein Q5741_14755 [Paenibacillus sp. JX-17]|uniref:DUF7660 domain-containing protein n=1 Tax=Paenibacillus lacisoli TaxID=3064525 RepID=A0ABT9CEG5_9BACL|nr:hypothetical protein [Paenibacillus sp. JX-17]MDO7907668.1 hypothetical protein [Paenibacillus sp. JX-17]